MGNRTAIYLRVSKGERHTANQRPDVERVIDERVNPPAPASFAERLQLALTLALGALLALPSGGASLITVAAELTFVASDLHQLGKQRTRSRKH